ncbi:helix-turn-helix transcriptional regulator [Tepidimonas aquatica]|uniref:WYL domain protein n=1 Tax=Tepidimonas aquatica TaxID=247482 RepID=A0A554WW57_9BURK|nr:WYL domain-containing protein [Tepidimonas aquatica]TSE27809.1 WYL domain protein [Tepidimonas aquatica]
MNRTERFYKIDQLLHERRVVSFATLLEELGVSRATLKRDLEYLRERLHAPIVWDRQAGGYRFDGAPATGPAYELPGLWFSAGELYALLAAQKLLADIEPGVLAAHVAPLTARLAALLEAGGHSAEAIARRVRLLSVARRAVEPRFFVEVSQALFERRRLEIAAYSRARDETNTRIISPQRLVHYRDNWYLDAWCHWRRGLRTFALDTLQRVKPLRPAAKEIPDAQLDAHLASAYGIFAGKPKAKAVLRFSPERARWVREERWHKDQVGTTLPDGSYRLEVPYADERELIMDILRHGRHVVVERPKVLRRRVAEEAAAVARLYAKSSRA